MGEFDDSHSILKKKGFFVFDNNLKESLYRIALAACFSFFSMAVGAHFWKVFSGEHTSSLVVGRYDRCSLGLSDHCLSLKSCIGKI